jgi:hypothetical protein
MIESLSLDQTYGTDTREGVADIHKLRLSREPTGEK